MLATRFDREVAALLRPEMGTERMAPLLYALVRSTRATNLLEVGLGYTTPFLARAVHDNHVDIERERRALVRKTRRMASLGARWVTEPPAFADPGYYLRARRGRLTVIDDDSHVRGGGARVVRLLRRLELDARVTLLRGDFRAFRDTLAVDQPRFDFVWFDCGGYQEYVDFLALYWDLIDDNGGLLVLHYTLTNLSMGAVVQGLKLRQATTEFNDFELLSLLEPDKTAQNSCTLVRKLRGFRERMHAPMDQRVLADSVELLRAVPATPRSRRSRRGAAPPG